MHKQNRLSTSGQHNKHPPTNILSLLQLCPNCKNTVGIRPVSEPIIIHIHCLDCGHEQKITIGED